MLRLNSFSLVLSGFLLLFTSISVQAQETQETTTEVTTSSAPISSASTTTPVMTERHVIITEVPAPKAAVTVPSNFINCFKVEAGWHNEVWVPEHQICQYTNAPEGAAWVEGYWTCSKYKTDTGDCTNWDWTDAHWVKVLDVY